MKIILNKSQWELIGKAARWVGEESEYNYSTLPPDGPIDLRFRPKKMPEFLHSKIPKKKFDIYNQPPVEFEYHINLNERGSFYADVRNSSGKTVFEIKAGNELPEGDSSIFEDGFMKNIHDMAGLKEYLVSLGIMKPNQILKDVQPRER